MEEDNFISSKERQEALDNNKNLAVFAREDSFLIKAPYFSEHIRRQLLAQYDQKTLYEQGLNIYTTLDIDREINMQKSLKTGLISIDKRQGFSGPIFQPTSSEEISRAHEIMAEVNKKNLFGLNLGFSLAQVKYVDKNIEAVFIATTNADQTTGAIPLAGMYWARKRDPLKHYDSSRLSSVGNILKPGDIILVKEQKEENLRKVAQQAKLVASFD